MEINHPSRSPKENKLVVEIFNGKCIWNHWKSTESTTVSNWNHWKSNGYLLEQMAFDAFGTTSGKTVSFLLAFLGFFSIFSPGSTGSTNSTVLSFRFDLFLPFTLELTDSSGWLLTTFDFFTFSTSIGSSRSSKGSSSLFTFAFVVLDFLISVFSSTFSWDAFFWTESAWHVFK